MTACIAGLIILIVFVLIFMFSLCRAAADGDRRLGLK